MAVRWMAALAADGRHARAPRCLAFAGEAGIDAPLVIHASHPDQGECGMTSPISKTNGLVSTGQLVYFGCIRMRGTDVIDGGMLLDGQCNDQHRNHASS